MAFKRKKEIQNPNHRPMRVSDMRNPVSKEQERVLKMLDESERKRGFRIRLERV